MGSEQARAVPRSLKSSIAFRGVRVKEGRKVSPVDSRAVLVLLMWSRVDRQLAPPRNFRLTSVRRRGLAKSLR